MARRSRSSATTIPRPTRRTCTSASCRAVAGTTSGSRERSTARSRRPPARSPRSGSRRRRSLLTVEDRGETHLVRVHTDGSAPELLTSGPITVRAVAAAGGTIACTAGAVDRVADVFVLRDGSPVALTDFGDRFARRRSAARLGAVRRAVHRRHDRARRVDHATRRLRSCAAVPRDAERARRPAHPVRRDDVRRGAVPGRRRVRRRDVEPPRRIGPRAVLRSGDPRPQAPGRPRHRLGQRRPRRRGRRARCRARAVRVLRSATASA